MIMGVGANMISGAMKANTEALLDAFIHIRYIYGCARRNGSS